MQGDQPQAFSDGTVGRSRRNAQRIGDLLQCIAVATMQINRIADERRRVREHPVDFPQMLLVAEILLRRSSRHRRQPPRSVVSQHPFFDRPATGEVQGEIADDPVQIAEGALHAGVQALLRRESQKGFLDDILRTRPIPHDRQDILHQRSPVRRIEMHLVGSPTQDNPPHLRLVRNLVGIASSRKDQLRKQSSKDDRTVAPCRVKIDGRRFRILSVADDDPRACAWCQTPRFPACV